ncbi:hypothetical protein Pyn_18864 [Prunus yedoensis var. nudiflora]|uniref:Uncharacterized protein n=1 Tax=Prunus yedoensis var. nudiflora TaxID=2094558 RepID=A0A314XFK3_PRUYE|nr:hypothetical protein Pyn_18864 [Prunus yedoensis var. nudiflora]
MEVSREAVEAIGYREALDGNVKGNAIKEGLFMMSKRTRGKTCLKACLDCGGGCCGAAAKDLGCGATADVTSRGGTYIT